jgi:hypothetical protein
MSYKTFSTVYTASEELRLPADALLICFDEWLGAIHDRIGSLLNQPLHRHASQSPAGSWIHLSFLRGVHTPGVLTGSAARRCEAIAPQA